MPGVGKSAATLRFFGDHLLPDEITKLLGASPTEAFVKGQQLVDTKTSKVFAKPSGGWLLRAADCEPEDLDGQVSRILGQLTDDLMIWRMLSAGYEVDLFCGLFLGGRDAGLTISPRTLESLGKRGIKLACCIYT